MVVGILFAFGSDQVEESTFGALICGGRVNKSGGRIVVRIVGPSLYSRGEVLLDIESDHQRRAPK